MQLGADVDDAQPLRVFEQIPQQVGQVEVRQVVDAHVHLEAVLGQRMFPKAQQPCIVHQDVHSFEVALHPVCKALDVPFAGQVNPAPPDVLVASLLLDPAHSLLTSCVVPGADDDLTALSSQA